MTETSLIARLRSTIRNPKEHRGSRPRCLLLTEGDAEAVALRLNSLVAPVAQIIPGKHHWAPSGIDCPAEVELPKASAFLSPEQRTALRDWWLVNRSRQSRTPNWDLVASATIGGREGLVLVEAKAHQTELSAAGKAARDPGNDANIALRVEEASSALGTILPGWRLSAASHYQLANRFAWAWKVVMLGVPVVLVYLGFVGADEMADRGAAILDQADWERMMADYGAGAVPEAVWHTPLSVNGTPLIALRRVVRVDLL